MSIAIEVDDVTAVLLADGWHDVAPNREGASSFTLDSYEYVWGEEVMHGGGNYDVCATGFVFTTKDGDKMAGPLTAVLAVRYSPA